MKPVNLLPESQRRRKPAGEGKSAYVVLGVLATLLVMTAAYVLTANKVTSLDSDAAAAAAEADQLEARAAELGAFGDFAATKEARVASVRDLAETRFDWERFIRELALVFPRGGWVQAVNASTTGDLEGSTTPSDTAPSGPAANITGCMPRQSDVAKTMVRIRRMYRVEDVTLKESVMEDLGGLPSVDSCGSFYKFDVTATFTPTVASEAPDGARRVPASLGGGS
jgi:Tfp pilus assembly protein PilN